MIAIVGPTCTGKSDLALSLAADLGGEIINADAMQVYRRFDIGTAKPPTADRQRITHHLIDVVEPWEHFSAGLFRTMAERAIDEIRGREKTPIVVGGTGLYVRALIYGLFDAPTCESLRKDLQRSFDEDPGALYGELQTLDAEYASKISPADRVRVVRALEVVATTGRAMSEWERSHGFRDARFETLMIGLTRSRDVLYRRINRRVEAMLAEGWIEEVKGLLRDGLDPNLKPFAGIGYREIVLYIQGSLSYEVMVEEIKKRTRRYAKRQATWFSKERHLHSFSYPEDLGRISLEAARFLQ